VESNNGENDNGVPVLVDNSISIHNPNDQISPVSLPISSTQDGGGNEESASESDTESSLQQTGMNNSAQKSVGAPEGVDDVEYL